MMSVEEKGVLDKAAAGSPITSSEETRDRILEAAACAFSEKGFSKATLRDIGSSAGVNFQSIRYHFGSKERLWETVVRTLSERIQEVGRKDQVAILALPPSEQLRAHILAVTKLLAWNPLLHRIFFREAMKGSDRYRKAYKQHVTGFIELSDNFLKRMQKEGIVKDDIPFDDLLFVFRGALLHRLIGPTDSEYYTGQLTTSPDVIERHADAIAKLLMK